MDDVKLLLHDMLKMHKTVKKADEFAWKEQYFVGCPACDGSRRYIWQPGDIEYKCAIWIRAEKLRLTNEL